MVASRFPVCPTMSGFAKLHLTKAYLPLRMAALVVSVISLAFMSGFASKLMF